MRIIVDGQSILGNRTGIGRYTYLLIKQLNGNTEIKELLVLFNQLLKTNSLQKIVHDLQVDYKNTRFPYKLIRRYLKPDSLYSIPVILPSKSSLKNTIFHATNYVHLPVYDSKQVVTIHDLAFMLYPETTDDKIYRHHMNWMPYTVEQSERIITDSEHTKKDIIKLLSVHESKIDVIPLAANDNFKIYDSLEIEKVKAKYNLPDIYILYVGTIEPRKNLDTLIEAFALAKEKYKLKAKLVIVGKKGWKFNPIFELIEKRKLQNEIIFTGYVEDNELPLIYNGAALFVLPSLYEGFGLPILEAFQSGVPVIAANNSSLPEVVGDSGILVNALSVEDWAENMADVLENEELSLSLINKGLERAKQFTWEEVAKKTVEVYKKI